jgi:hypothetical protein
VLYQKNIEAVSSSEAGVHEQIRLTVIHELGHYFGMDENQLKRMLRVIRNSDSQPELFLTVVSFAQCPTS